MKNPLETLGYKLLSSASPDLNESLMPNLSRRGFIALSAVMGSSCSMISGKEAEQAKADPGAATPTKTGPNNGYRTPKV